jgi:hypothetical protein
MKRKRTPAHKVNRRQKALAIKALTAIVSSPDAAEYVRAKAAAALLNNGRDAPDSDTPLRDPDAPRIYTVLPDNERQPDVRYGLYDEDQFAVIVPKGWPMEVTPESHYAGVPKPLPDPRFARYRAVLRGPDDIELVCEQFDEPEIILSLLEPEIAALREKDERRKNQRRGNRQPTGNPRGRPRLSPEKAAESAQRRRAYMCELMRRKRAKR